MAAVPLDLSVIPSAAHREAMRLAIAEARANPAFPFGAVIVRGNDRAVMARGVNGGTQNPTWHGEIVALNDYVARHGHQGWKEMILYTTGEPCPMCMAALAWARMGGIVYGTTIAKLRDCGIDQIMVPAADIAAAAPFFRGQLLGPLFSEETDPLFEQRLR
jgi:tRNA(adenine34) deaminase